MNFHDLFLKNAFEIISNSPISSSPIKVNRNRGGAFYVSEMELTDL